MLTLNLISKNNSKLLLEMENHYSQPKGFVGRSLIYEIKYDDIRYGSIVAGSATKFLPGRNEFFNFLYGDNWGIDSIINNTFFHIEKINNKYPIYNFSQHILNKFQKIAKIDWEEKYGYYVLGFETLIELPRTGELYKRNGFYEVGKTKGYSCKRTGGKGTDSWSGKRVWDTINLRPKLVLVKS